MVCGRSTCVLYSYHFYLSICESHTYRKLRNFSDSSLHSLILNYDSKLSTGAVVPLFWPDSAVVRQCHEVRAAVPQVEFDKSLSFCFDRPIYPL